MSGKKATKAQKAAALRYPLSAFPLRGPATLQDWVPIDGAWHNVSYVFDPRQILPELYLDGELAGKRSESALFDRCLSREEIAALYRAGSAPLSYHEAVEAAGGKFVDLSKGGKP
jgi:hypothetical protein